MDHRARTERVAAQLDRIGVDAILVTDLINVRYLTGFSGTNGQALVSSSGVWFYTDPRYEGSASTLVKDAEIGIYPKRLHDVLAPRLRELGAHRVGFEASSVTVAELSKLEASIAEVELVATDGLVEELRRVKDPDEVAAIRAAVRLADEAFAWILDRLVPGATERQIALDLEVRMRAGGGEATSFDPIVGSGPLSAHIHHTPSDRELEKGDLVLLDFGARYEGYCSDLTRTVVLGPASEDQRTTYELVLAAQRNGIAAIAPGVGGADVDRTARSTIAAAGYGERFGHGLGHGVGLDIHEAPTLKDISEDQLRAGEVITVEPGVYVPDRDGIRIEDCVLVTEDGPDVLTSAPKDTLLEL
jgi:Xaa-Pro aminopeptidase